jgi:beta-lactam-binding protein with PASTA domain
MPRRVPADLEDALASSPSARERFWSLPPEHKDAWVGWIDRARLPRARRRRIAEAVRRLGGGRTTAATTAVETNGAGPAVLPREDTWLVWLIGLVLLAALAAFLVWLTVYRHHSSSRPGAVVVTAKATVPRVVGLRVQAAQFQLHQSKLGATVVQHASRKPKGIVIGQKPAGGANVSQGTQVNLLVSTGPPRAQLPDLTGLAAADAVKQLQALKLAPVLKQTPSQQPPGTVIAQKPAAGAHVKQGSKVVLEVAKGKASISVPNVTGQTQQQAVALLTHAGLKASVAQVPSSQPQGTVVAQNPAAGQKLARGGAVRLNVSRGSTTTATTTQRSTTQQATTTTSSAPPQGAGNDYRGMQLSAAVQKITQGRQQVIVVYVASSKPAGVVVSNATVGSRERLAVSAGAQPQSSTSVPDVTGESADKASHDLSGAGFKVLEVQWPVSDQSQDGMVTYETPTGSAPRGVAVVVYVGSFSG